MRNKDTKQTNSKKKTTEKKTPKNERTEQIRAKGKNLKTFDDI